MRFIAINYSKISIEKKSNDLKNLKIATGLDIKSIEAAKPGVFQSEESFLNVSFKYYIDYKEEIAKIEMEGNMLWATDSKGAKEILKAWENKKLDDNLKIKLLNVILIKANIKAIQLEEEMNLPIHFRMPTINSEKK